jgi:hypothetical protein
MRRDHDRWMARGQRLLQDATPSADPLPIQAAFRFIDQ